MITDKDDLRFVTARAVRRVEFGGKVHPTRTQKRVILADDKIAFMEAIRERIYANRQPFVQPVVYTAAELVVYDGDGWNLRYPRKREFQRTSGFFVSGSMAPYDTTILTVEPSVEKAELNNVRGRLAESWMDEETYETLALPVTDTVTCLPGEEEGSVSDVMAIYDAYVDARYAAELQCSNAIDDLEEACATAVQQKTSEYNAWKSSRQATYNSAIDAETSRYTAEKATKKAEEDANVAAVRAANTKTIDEICEMTTVEQAAWFSTANVNIETAERRRARVMEKCETDHAKNVVDLDNAYKEDLRTHGETYHTYIENQYRTRDAGIKTLEDALKVTVDGMKRTACAQCWSKIQSDHVTDIWYWVSYENIHSQAWMDQTDILEAAKITTSYTAAFLKNRMMLSAPSQQLLDREYGDLDHMNVKFVANPAVVRGAYYTAFELYGPTSTSYILEDELDYSRLLNTEFYSSVMTGWYGISGHEAVQSDGIDSSKELAFYFGRRYDEGCVTGIDLIVTVIRHEYMGYKSSSGDRSQLMKITLTDGGVQASSSIAQLDAIDDEVLEYREEQRVILEAAIAAAEDTYQNGLLEADATYDAAVASAHSTCDAAIRSAAAQLAAVVDGAGLAFNTAQYERILNGEEKENWFNDSAYVSARATYESAVSAAKNTRDEAISEADDVRQETRSTLLTQRNTAKNTARNAYISAIDAKWNAVVSRKVAVYDAVESEKQDIRDQKTAKDNADYATLQAALAAAKSSVDSATESLRSTYSSWTWTFTTYNGWWTNAPLDDTERATLSGANLNYQNVTKAAGETYNLALASNNEWQWEELSEIQDIRFNARHRWYGTVPVDDTTSGWLIGEYESERTAIYNAKKAEAEQAASPWLHPPGEGQSFYIRFHALTGWYTIPERAWDTLPQEYKDGLDNANGIYSEGVDAVGASTKRNVFVKNVLYAVIHYDHKTDTGADFSAYHDEVYGPTGPSGGQS